MADTIETWFFQGEAYVEPREAARYLDMKYKTLLAYIAGGKVPVVQIESRHMIRLDDLWTYADSRQGRAIRENWI